MGNLIYPGNSDFLNYSQFSYATDAADQYGRARVVSPSVLFSSSLDLGDDSLLWNSTTATGGSGTYNSTKKRYDLAVTTSSGSQALRESRQRGFVQPGRSCMAIMTALLGSGQANTEQRVGVFTDNNGYFWVLSGTTLKICHRNKVSGSVVDTLVSQTSFNLDTLDGAGNSLVNLDLTKIQQFVIEWTHMGSGMVRFGVMIQGRVVWAHVIDQNNNSTEVFMQTGTLPIRYEIINTGVASVAKTLVQGGCALLVDGPLTPFGRNFGLSLGVNGKALSVSAHLPLFLLRVKSTIDYCPVILKHLQIGWASNGVDGMDVQILLNPSVTGSPSYTSVDSNSSLEYNVTSTGTISGGTLLANFAGGIRYGNSNGGYEVNLEQLFDRQEQIFKKYAGTQDLLCICAQGSNGYGAGNTGQIMASFNWKELDG